MIKNAVEGTHGRTPTQPEGWCGRVPQLCDGIGADFVLVDQGPSNDRTRFTIIGLTPGVRGVYLFESLTTIHAPAEAGGLGILSSLFVPLHRNARRHSGHIAALYRTPRDFCADDVTQLQAVAESFTRLLTEG